MWDFGVSLSSCITGCTFACCSFWHVIAEIFDIWARIATPSNWTSALGSLLFAWVDLSSGICLDYGSVLFRWFGQALIISIRIGIKIARNWGWSVSWLSIAQKLFLPASVLLLDKFAFTMSLVEQIGLDEASPNYFLVRFWSHSMECGWFITSDRRSISFIPLNAIRHRPEPNHFVSTIRLKKWRYLTTVVWPGFRDLTNAIYSHVSLV
jgi:hypothetical protein